MDAVQMEVVYRATAQIAKELALNMLRTGYSSVIKESQDFTFSIFDGVGRMVTQGLPQPLHIGGISAQVGEVIRVFGDAMWKATSSSSTTRTWPARITPPT